MLANPYLPIIPQRTRRLTSVRELVGTGPFRAVEVDLGRRTVLERNDTCWGSDRAGPIWTASS